MPEQTYFLLIEYILLGMIFGCVVFYLPWCLVARKFIIPDWYTLSLYASTAFFVAICTEPIHDFVYKYFFGEYLWIYQVLPLFGGASTVLAPLAWPFYGYYTYFMHEAFKSRSIALPIWARGIIPGVDGVPYDMIGNLFALFLAGNYFFYYPREELWHLSAFWVIPLYIISGLIYMYVLEYLRTQKKNWTIPVGVYCLGIGVMVIGEIVYKMMTT